MREDEKKSFFKETALPFLFGLATYVAIRATNIVPKEWSFLPRLKGDGVPAAFVNGLGNVKNAIAAAAGTLTSLIFRDLISKTKSKTASMPTPQTDLPNEETELSGLAILPEDRHVDNVRRQRSNKDGRQF